MFDHKLRDAHLTELGRIMVNFAGLEEILGVVIGSLIGTEEKIGDLVCAQLSFDRKVGLLDSMIRKKTSDVAVLEKLKQTLSRVSAVEQVRNKIMHSEWISTEAEPDLIVRMKQVSRRGKGLERQFESYSVDALRKVAKEMHDSAEALFYLYQAYLKATKARRG